MARGDNAAQPLLDLRAKIGEYARKLTGRNGSSIRTVSAAGRPNTSWHDAMVRRANASFRDAAARKKNARTSTARSSRRSR